MASVFLFFSIALRTGSDREEPMIANCRQIASLAPSGAWLCSTFNIFCSASAAPSFVAAPRFRGRRDEADLALEAAHLGAILAEVELRHRRQGRVELNGGARTWG